MDIKLKKFSHSILIKFLLFIVIVASFTFVISPLLGIGGNDYQVLEVLSDDSYFDSYRFDRNFYYKLNDIKNIIVNAQLRVAIENGDTITNEKIKERLLERIKDEKILKEDYSILKSKYFDEISKIKDEIKKEEIEQSLKESQRYKIEGINYYVLNKDIEVTNVEKFKKKDFISNDFHILLTDGKIIVEPEIVNENSYPFSHYVNTLEEIGDEIYLTIPNEKINEGISNWKSDRSNAEVLIKKLLISFVAGLIAFIWLIIVTGRDGESKKNNLNFIDKLYVDINIMVIIGLLSLLVFTFEVISKTTLNIDTDMYYYYITGFISSLGLILVLSLVRQLKNKTFIKNTISYFIIAKIFYLIKRILIKISNLFKKVLNIKAFGYKIINIQKLNDIKNGAKKIKEGNLDYKINIDDKGILKELSEDINMIAQGLKKAVFNEVKSQRMKTELITNVSHDIRTPLTSIITYVDLIKSEDSKEKQNEYIEIIDRKSQRLKTLADDLFEVSKVSSGNIKFEKEKIDLVSLINQGLGEFENKIEKSKLDFKINFEDEKKIYINADGKLLWRAIENLFSNIFKYALEGSRVYIDVIEINNIIKIIFKNISKYELNISEEELMQRFTRGDKSRSSEGSGLGLSIAKSLVEVQDGKFEVKIDGDLFKVNLEVEKWNNDRVD